MTYKSDDIDTFVLCLFILLIADYMAGIGYWAAEVHWPLLELFRIPATLTVVIINLMAISSFFFTARYVVGFRILTITVFIVAVGSAIISLCKI